MRQRHSYLTTAVLAALLWLAAIPASAQPARAWQLLEEGLKSDKVETRTAAAYALGLMAGNARALQLAEWVLSDQHESVRAAGAEALGQIGLPAARAALKKALKDESAEVVFSAASALFELKDPAAYEVYYAVLTGERKSGEGLVQSQLDLLKDPQALAKIGFETGIGYIPFGGIGYKAVKAFTADKTSPVRAAAAQKLITDPDPRSGLALISALKDDKWMVRVAAVNALARRDDRRQVGVISPLLADEHESVRFNAAAATIRLTP
jgi:HEAT repeat protein